MKKIITSGPGLAKMILQDTVNEKRRRGRPKKRWKDRNRSEWPSPAQLGQLKTEQIGKGLLRSHLWCPNDVQYYGRKRKIDIVL